MTTSTLSSDTPSVVAVAPAVHRFRLLGLVGLAASVFVAVLDQTVLTVATPALMADLGGDLRSVEWVIAGYSMVLAALMILAGRVGDLVGHKKLMVTGLALFGAGSLLSALAPTVPWLFAGNAVVEGIG